MFRLTIQVNGLKVLVMLFLNKSSNPGSSQFSLVSYFFSSAGIEFGNFLVISMKDSHLLLQQLAQTAKLLPHIFYFSANYLSIELL